MSGEVDMLEYHHDCESGRCPGELYPSAAYQPHGRDAEVHWTPTGEWTSELYGPRGRIDTRQPFGVRATFLHSGEMTVELESSCAWTC